MSTPSGLCFVVGDLLLLELPRSSLNQPTLVRVESDGDQNVLGQVIQRGGLHTPARIEQGLQFPNPKKRLSISPAGSEDSSSSSLAGIIQFANRG